MNPKPDHQATLEDTVSLYLQAGRVVTEAARLAGVPRRTFGQRLQRARAAGLLSDEPAGKCETCGERDALRDQMRSLQRQVRSLQRDRATTNDVRKYIFKLAEVNPDPPEWLFSRASMDTGLGVPTLVISDVHWGEVVVPDQVFGKNKYNLEIAERRLKRVTERAIDLLFCHALNPDYPGLVLALAGDLHSGNIHEELTATNEVPIMPAFVGLFENMIAMITAFAARFEKVFLPCVIGNHDRSTAKMHYKDAAYKSFDWLLYTMLEKWFAGNDRIQFLVSPAIDARYRVYKQRHCLTHGHQFRGGQGFGGPLFPIVRGDKKKRAAAASYHMDFETLVLGHWHTHAPVLPAFVANGSVVGYNEFAIQNNLSYERPRQALWLTHPRHGPTDTRCVYADDPPDESGEEWVSWRT